VREKKLELKVAKQAFKDLEIDAEKVDPASA